MLEEDFFAQKDKEIYIKLLNEVNKIIKPNKDHNTVKKDVNPTHTKKGNVFSKIWHFFADLIPGKRSTSPIGNPIISKNIAPISTEERQQLEKELKTIFENDDFWKPLANDNNFIKELSGLPKRNRNIFIGYLLNNYELLQENKNSYTIKGSQDIQNIFLDFLDLVESQNSKDVLSKILTDILGVTEKQISKQDFGNKTNLVKAYVCERIRELDNNNNYKKCMASVDEKQIKHITNTDLKNSKNFSTSSLIKSLLNEE